MIFKACFQIRSGARPSRAQQRARDQALEVFREFSSTAFQLKLWPFKTLVGRVAPRAPLKPRGYSFGQNAFQALLERVFLPLVFICVHLWLNCVVPP